MGMVGEACLPSNAYYPRTPDYTLCSGVHVCWSEHSDSSFVYGFMILNYGFGTMTATTFRYSRQIVLTDFLSLSSVNQMKDITRKRRIWQMQEIKARSECTFALSDQGLPFPLKNNCYYKLIEWTGNWLTHCSWETPKRVICKSAAPDQTPPNAASDQALH